MGFSIHCRWLAALSCVFWLGTGVRCDCTEQNLKIQGGNYTLSDNLETGSILVYRCPTGYYPYPERTRLCQRNGSWRPPPKRSRSQRCRLVECPNPNVLEYGNVSPPQDRYLVYNETTYECYSGFKMRGSSRRVCLKNGKWSGSTPICSRDSGDHCADPGIPPGASRDGTMFGIDDRVRYTCNNNLLLVGSKERVCQENGQWTGEEPQCYYKHTFDTPLEISKAFGSSIKETLTILESTDDIQGERKIRISKNGILNIYIGVDISGSIEEENVIKSRNAVLKLITKISSFSVTPNYEIIFFSSELYEIVNIIDFLDGKPLDVKSKLEEFVVGDRNTGTNLNLVFEKFWEKMSVIKIRTGEEGFKEHRHALIVFTDGGFNMGGSPAPTVAKIKNTVYMNESKAREDYLDIYIFAIGDEIYDADLMPLTAGTGERHYFRLNDLEKLQETFDEMIDEDDVKGLCGLHKEYQQRTDEHMRKMHPWLVLVHTQVNGRSEKCMGSLVTPDFVLTAAHCLHGLLPVEVTIEIDDGLGNAKKAKAIIPHEKYNVTAKKHIGINEFYDYDVALIQLEEYVQISTDVRPICIPCTLETSAALHLVNQTCKAQEELLLNKDIEGLNFLTKKGNHLKDIKEVHAKLGDRRYECIQQAVGAQGITQETLTEAVTDNFICTGGLQPLRDDISCQGDSGGAVFKNFEHRTIQVGLVSWGNENVCETRPPVSTQTSRDFHINLFRVVPFLKSVLAKKNQDYAPLEFLKN